MSTTITQVLVDQSSPDTIQRACEVVEQQIRSRRFAVYAAARECGLAAARNNNVSAASINDGTLVAGTPLIGWETAYHNYVALYFYTHKKLSTLENAHALTARDASHATAIRRNRIYDDAAAYATKLFQDGTRKYDGTHSYGVRIDDKPLTDWEPVYHSFVVQARLAQALLEQYTTNSAFRDLEDRLMGEQKRHRETERLLNDANTALATARSQANVTMELTVKKQKEANAALAAARSLVTEHFAAKQKAEQQRDTALTRERQLARELTAWQAVNGRLAKLNEDRSTMHEQLTNQCSTIDEFQRLFNHEASQASEVTSALLLAAYHTKLKTELADK